MADNTTPDLVITTLEELKAFRDEVNNGNTYKGKTVVLAADIDLKNEEWTPIGNSTNKFQGNFDGGNHTISNLKITGNKSNVGFFGYTCDGSVSNLTIENANVSGYLEVGVVAGTPYTSTYTNIKVTGHVEVNGYAYVGGVGGKNAYADWTDITVDVDETSFVKAVSKTETVNNRTYVGGVIGFMGEGGHTLSNISSNINVEGSTCDVGGIVGIAHYGNNFENVSCTAKEIVVNSDDAEVGAIAGVWFNDIAPVTMTNCTAGAETKVYKTVTGENGEATREVVDALTGAAYSSSGSGKLYQQTTDDEGNIVSVTITDNSNVAYEVDKSKFVVDSDFSAKYDFPASSGLMFGVNAFASLKDAADKAVDGVEIELLSNGKAAANFDGGGTVTLTGTADLDWSGANFMVGRGTNAQDTTVIIKDAAIGSTSNQASTGFHVSGAEKDSSSKANGTLIIDNSAVVTDYLINKNVVDVIGDGDYNDDEIDLTVKRGFGIAGRPSGETPSGTAHTAEMNITNGAYVKIDNENGMGIGHYDADEGKGVDGKGILNITDSKFESTQYLNVRTHGTVNVTNGELIVAGTLNNNGTVSISGESELNIGTLTGNNANLLDGAVLTGSTVGGNIDIVGASATLKGEGSFGKVVIQGNADEVRKLTIAENAVIDATHLDTGSGLQTDALINNTADRKANGIVEVKGEMNVFNGGTSGAVYLRPYSELLVTGTLTVNGELHNRGSLYIDGGEVKLTGFAHHKLLGYAASGDRLVITNGGVLDITDQEKIELGYTSHPNDNSNVQPQYATGMYAEISNGGKFTAASECFRNNCALTVTGAGSEFVITDGDAAYTNANGSWNQGTITVTDGALFDISGMDKELVNNDTITVDADSLFKAGVLTNNGSIIIDASGFTGGIKKVIDLNGTAQLAGVTFTNVADGVNSVLGADGDVTLVKKEVGALYVKDSYISDDAVNAEVGGNLTYGVDAFSSVKSAFEKAIELGGGTIRVLGTPQDVVSGSDFNSLIKMTGASGMDFVLTGTHAGNEFVAIEMRNDAATDAEEDFVLVDDKKATLLVTDADMAVYKLAAYTNSVITIENSTLDFRDAQNGLIYTKGNGEMYVSNSVLKNMNQLSARGTLLAVTDSFIDGGSGNTVYGGTMSLTGSTFNYSGMRIGDGGVLMLENTKMVSNSVKSAKEAANKTTIGENEIALYVGYGNASSTAAVTTGTLNLKNAEFSIAKGQKLASDGSLTDTTAGTVNVSASGTVNVEDSKFSADIVDNSGNFNVSGVSQLNIGTLTGKVELNGTTLTDSVIGGGAGDVHAYGNVIVENAEFGNFGSSRTGLTVMGGTTTLKGDVSTLVLGTDHARDTEVEKVLVIADGANVSVGLTGENGTALTVGYLYARNDAEIIIEDGAKLNLNGQLSNRGTVTLKGKMEVAGVNGTGPIHLAGAGDPEEYGMLNIVGGTLSDRQTSHVNANDLHMVTDMKIGDDGDTNSVVKVTDNGKIVTTNSYWEILADGELNVTNGSVDIAAPTNNTGVGLTWTPKDHVMTNAGKIAISNSTFNVASLANSGTVNVEGVSTIVAPTVTGDGWIYMNGATLNSDSEIIGGKVRFAKGTSVIDGAVIDDGFFQVGIGAYEGQDSKVDTANGVTVTVKNNAHIGANGETYAGWVGTGFYDTDAEKAAAMTAARYTLNINNSIAEFGYMHVSQDGLLNVSGNAAEKAHYNNSYYSFYAGDFIINGVATFDGVDVLALYTKVSCDNGTDNPGTLNITNGAYYEAERHNGAIDGTNFVIYKTGVVNVTDNATLHIGEYTDIAADGKLNVSGATFKAEGTVTNNGTVNISGASDISAEISGTGMVYLRDAALDADTEISGSGRLRFVKGENTITGSTINAEYFQVGARKEDSNLSGESVKLTVKDATITCSGSDSHAGWVGSGYGIAAVDGVTYTMALENTAAAFSYLHISDDGNFSVTGSVSDDRKLYRESEYRTFYAGNFIVNGSATFKNTDVRLQKLSINCDNQSNGKIGKLTVDGSYLRLVRSGGTGSFQLWNGGVLSIVNDSYTYARNITFDAGSNGEVLTGSTFNVDALTNNSAITVDYQSLFAFNTISGNGSFTIDMTGYNGGFYKVLDYTGDGSMDYSFVSGFGTNDKLVEIDEDLYVADADQSVLYVNSAYNAENSGSHLFGYNAFNSFAGALDVVGNGGNIVIENSVADEVSKEIEFTKDIAFTISGTAPAHALPVVTFLNADVTVKDAEILIPELDARQDAIITIDNSTVHDAGGNSIVKSYYNGAIKIVNGSTVHTMQTTTMGYITIDNATLNATWQTNVYGNGLITVTNGANFNTAALHLTGQDYSGRDNTDTERVGKAAEVVVDGARMVVGRVYSDNGADYSYNSSKGMNIGTKDGKNAVLTAKNNAVIEFWGADGETVNIGAGGMVDVAGSTFSVGCRAENGTVTLNNAGTINVSGASDLSGIITNSENGTVNFADGTVLTSENGLTYNGLITPDGKLTFDDGVYSLGTLYLDGEATREFVFADGSDVTASGVLSVEGSNVATIEAGAKFNTSAGLVLGGNAPEVNVNGSVTNAANAEMPTAYDVNFDTVCFFANTATLNLTDAAVRVGGFYYNEAANYDGKPVNYTVNLNNSQLEIQTYFINAGYQITGKGEWNVVNSKLYSARNDLYFDAASTMNLTDSVIDFGGINNAGTITVGGTSQLNIGTLTGTSYNGAIRFRDGAAISESSIGGDIHLLSGTHNWSGKNTVSGMFSAGYYNYGGNMTVNITGDFSTSNLVAYASRGQSTVVNIGSADGSRTIFDAKTQMGIFENTTVNVANADVTYTYTFIRSAFNVANSTMTIGSGTNTYFAGNAVVMVENTVWTSGSYTCLGSYNASEAAGNADVTIKNGSLLNAGNLTLTTATGTDYIVKLTVDDATVNASTALNVGAGTTVCITGGTVNAAALNNNGTLTLDHKSTIAFSTLTNSGTITVDTTGYTNGEFLLFDYTGNDSKDMAFYESILGDLSKSFIIKDNGDLYYNKANAIGSINPNDSSAYQSHEEAIAAGCEELITVDGAFDSKLAHEGLTSTIRNGTFMGTVAGGANVETAKDREFADRSGNTDLTINGGVFEKNVFGGDRVDRGYFERIGVVNTTINDGTFKEYVCGGGMYVYRQLHGELIQTGDINLTINGGEFAKNVYGGNLAFESLYSGQTTVDGNITITINAEKAMKFDQDIIAGSYQSGIVNGDVKVKFTGSGSNLTFDSTSQIWGGCTADRYYTDRRFESAITGDRNFTFDAFTGEFTARIRGFESMDVVNGSAATLTGADLSDINVWTMESGSSLDGSFGNDFKGDTLNILLDEEWSGSDWTLLSGNVTNWDKFSSVQLGGEAAEFTNGAWVSASYDLTVQEDENGKKSLVFGKLA